MIRVFQNNKLNVRLQMLTYGNKRYFQAKGVALALGYKDPKAAINNHVFDEYKVKLCDLKGAEKHLPPNAQPHAIYLTEPGLHQLVFGSHLPAAKAFQKWVFEDVLPSIQQTGEYKPRTMDTKRIENEFDLHSRAVLWIWLFAPYLRISPGLGENQDTSDKRIKSKRKGYPKGEPDLKILNYNVHYRGLIIEFKSPTGKGVLGEEQSELLEDYAEDGFKVVVTSSYDRAIMEIMKYIEGIRIPCRYCHKKYKDNDAYVSHLVGFHKETDAAYLDRFPLGLGYKGKMQNNIPQYINDQRERI